MVNARRSVVLLAAFAALYILVIGLVRIAAEAPRPAAPDFRLLDDKGRTLRLSALKGRVVVLDFWATWCTGCKREIPWFEQFQRTYQTQGLSSIGVALDEEGWNVVRPFLAKHPISYSVVAADDTFAKQYGF